MQRIELERRRSLGDLVTASFNVFTQHFSLLFTLAVLVVAPYEILVNGVWGRQLADGAKADPGSRATSASLAIALLVVQPLVTALVVRAVLAVARGQTPSVRAALREAGPVFLPATAAIALAACGIFIGLLLIVPGVWLAVRWAFAAQAVVADGERGLAALARSAEVVRGQWWSTLGRLIVLNVIAGAIEAVILVPAGAIHNGAIYVSLGVIASAAALSYGAVATTLLFFDRRAGARS